jgi:elongation factor G
MALIHAQAPLAELSQYSGQLRGLTSGQASFVMEPSHYDYVPQIVQKKIVASHGASKGAEEDE